MTKCFVLIEGTVHFISEHEKEAKEDAKLEKGAMSRGHATVAIISNMALSSNWLLSKMMWWPKFLDQWKGEGTMCTC